MSTAIYYDYNLVCVLHQVRDLLPLPKNSYVFCKVSFRNIRNQTEEVCIDEQTDHIGVNFVSTSDSGQVLPGAVFGNWDLSREDSIGDKELLIIRVKCVEKDKLFQKVHDVGVIAIKLYSTAHSGNPNASAWWPLSPYKHMKTTRGHVRISLYWESKLNSRQASMTYQSRLLRHFSSQSGDDENENEKKHGTKWYSTILGTQHRSQDKLVKLGAKPLTIGSAGVELVGDWKLDESSDEDEDITESHQHQLSKSSKIDMITDHDQNDPYVIDEMTQMDISVPTFSVKSKLFQKLQKHLHTPSKTIVHKKVASATTGDADDNASVQAKLQTKYRAALKVEVLQARGLISADNNGLSDPYVIIKLKSNKRKTSVKWKNLSPVWNESFVFGGDLSPNESISTDDTLTFLVKDRDNIKFDDDLGLLEIPLWAVRNVDHKSKEGQSHFENAQVHIMPEGTVDSAFSVQHGRSLWYSLDKAPGMNNVRGEIELKITYYPAEQQDVAKILNLDNKPSSLVSAENSKYSLNTVVNKCATNVNTYFHRAGSDLEPANATFEKLNTSSVSHDNCLNHFLRLKTSNTKTFSVRPRCEVRVFHARNLRAADAGGTSDPYVVVSCRKRVEVSNVVWSTLNPVWNQSFVFGDDLDYIEWGDTIKIAVRDKDKWSRDDHLGEVVLPLWAMSDCREPEWHALQPTPLRKLKKHSKSVDEAMSTGENAIRDLGEILIQVLYTDPNYERYKFALPKAIQQYKGKVWFYQCNATIIAGRNLPVSNANGTTSSYCIVVCGAHQERTRTVSGTVSPVWKETFHFKESNMPTSRALNRNDSIVLLVVANQNNIGRKKERKKKSIANVNILDNINNSHVLGACVIDLGYLIDRVGYIDRDGKVLIDWFDLEQMPGGFDFETPHLINNKVTSIRKGPGGLIQRIRAKSAALTTANTKSSAVPIRKSSFIAKTSPKSVKRRNKLKNTGPQIRCKFQLLPVAETRMAQSHRIVVRIGKTRGLNADAEMPEPESQFEATQQNQNLASNSPTYVYARAKIGVDCFETTPSRLAHGHAAIHQRILFNNFEASDFDSTNANGRNYQTFELSFRTENYGTLLGTLHSPIAQLKNAPNHEISGWFPLVLPDLDNCEGYSKYRSLTLNKSSGNMVRHRNNVTKIARDIPEVEMTMKLVTIEDEIRPILGHMQIRLNQLKMITHSFNYNLRCDLLYGNKHVATPVYRGDVNPMFDQDECDFRFPVTDMFTELTIEVRDMKRDASNANRKVALHRHYSSLAVNGKLLGSVSLNVFDLLEQEARLLFTTFGFLHDVKPPILKLKLRNAKNFKTGSISLHAEFTERLSGILAPNANPISKQDRKVSIANARHEFNRFIAIFKWLPLFGSYCGNVLAWKDPPTSMCVLTILVMFTCLDFWSERPLALIPAMLLVFVLNRYRDRTNGIFVSQLLASDVQGVKNAHAKLHITVLQGRNLLNMNANSTSQTTDSLVRLSYRSDFLHTTPRIDIGQTRTVYNSSFPVWTETSLGYKPHNGTSLISWDLTPSKTSHINYDTSVQHRAKSNEQHRFHQVPCFQRYFEKQLLKTPVMRIRILRARISHVVGDQLLNRVTDKGKVGTSFSLSAGSGVCTNSSTPLCAVVHAVSDGINELDKMRNELISSKFKTSGSLYCTVTTIDGDTIGRTDSSSDVFDEESSSIGGGKMSKMFGLRHYKEQAANAAGKFSNYHQQRQPQKTAIGDLIELVHDSKPFIGIQEEEEQQDDDLDIDHLDVAHTAAVAEIQWFEEMILGVKYTITDKDVVCISFHIATAFQVTKRRTSEQTVEDMKSEYKVYIDCSEVGDAHKCHIHGWFPIYEVNASNDNESDNKNEFQFSHVRDPATDMKDDMGNYYIYGNEVGLVELDIKCFGMSNSEYDDEDEEEIDADRSFTDPETYDNIASKVNVAVDSWKLCGTQIFLDVFDEDNFSKKEFIGRVNLALSDLIFDDSVHAQPVFERWIKLDYKYDGYRDDAILRKTVKEKRSNMSRKSMLDRSASQMSFESITASKRRKRDSIMSFWKKVKPNSTSSSTSSLSRDLDSSLGGEGDDLGETEINISQETMEDCNNASELGEILVRAQFFLPDIEAIERLREADEAKKADSGGPIQKYNLMMKALGNAQLKANAFNNNFERLKNLFNWSHPRKTRLVLWFLTFSILLCVVIPSRYLLLAVGLYLFTEHFRPLGVVLIKIKHLLALCPTDEDIIQVYTNGAIQSLNNSSLKHSSATDDDKEQANVIEDEVEKDSKAKKIFKNIKAAYYHSVLHKRLNFKEAQAANVVVTPSDCKIMGYLRMLEGGHLRGFIWRRYYFAIANGILLYWAEKENMTKTVPLGIIRELISVSSVSPDSNDANFAVGHGCYAIDSIIVTTHASKVVNNADDEDVLSAASKKVRTIFVANSVEKKLKWIQNIKEYCLSDDKRLSLI